MGKQHFLIEKREEGEFMKIGLLGFEFDSPNKGCEALGYSFVSLIKKNYPDKVEFYVFTNDELGLFPEYFDDICFEKVPLKIKDFSFQMIKAMRKCDFIFDVTLGDSFSDIYSIDQCLSNIRFKFLAEIFGRKYILLPQTYGPFEDKKCRDRSIHILNHADYIFCRDKKSMEYIRALGIKSTHLQLTTDMAFALHCPKDECKSMIYRGNGWPGRVTAVRNDGQEYSMDYNTAWMSILGRVIRRSCKFCVDSIGEAADISCGDYWKLDENNNPSFEEADGVNCIFTWTNKGNELLNLIAKEKNICIQKENIDKLKYAQPNHFNRRCTILYKTIAMRMFFRKSPKYAFSKMFLLAKYKSLRDGFRIFKGTVKRILQGRI